MSVIIKLTFPAGRYHATPWGRHVNEGVPEWPPSPWRLLRALIAVWRRTCPSLAEARVRRILEAHAQPPQFQLPRFRVAHTRHYMPWEKKGPADRTLVFDTFICVSRHEPLFIGWPDAELSSDDRAVLAKLLANMSSLGRAEAWVHAELTIEPLSWNCCCAAETDPNPVPVLCPDPATAFGNEHYPTLDTNKLAKRKVNPADFLFDCPRWHLCLDTETIHDKKWPTVPGTKWVNYTRPLEASAAPAEPKSTDRRTPTVARFLLDGPVLPLVTDTLRVAEAFRHAVMSRFQRHCHRRKYGEVNKPYQELFRSEVLSGKDMAGQFLRHHRHAFYLPTAEGKDRRWITHVTIAAGAGFGTDEVAALNAVRTLRVDDDSCELRVQLVGLGDRQDFRAPLLEQSAVWTSATPFVVTRYAKKRGRKRDRPELLGRDNEKLFAEQVLFEELARLRERLPDLIAPLSVEPLEGHAIGPHKLRAIHFRRIRRKREDDGGRRPSGAFRIVFPHPVAGPLCLGHSSHFGLGMFLPEPKVVS